MSFQDIGRRKNNNPPAAAASPYRTQGGGGGGFDQSSISLSTQNSSSPTGKYKSGTMSSFSSGGLGTSTGAANSNTGSLIQPMDSGESNEYTAISQAILQYQQNVGILSNIVQSIGGTTTQTPPDTQVLTQQYHLQTDVIQQLSSKITLQLEQLEHQKTNNKQHRATHLKLTRDYKWVETKYKNLQLDGRRKWNMVEMEKRRIVEEEQRRNLEHDLDHDTSQLQMQLRDDRIVEEIMREREDEVRKINKGMHQVNQIYKDLANIVSYQQDQVDEVEGTMEQANKSAESGLKQIEKAHKKSVEGNCIVS